MDECFCNDEVVTALLASGYTVEKFTDHFPRGNAHGLQQSVKDPRIIQLSHRKGWLILTTDSNMRVTHVEEFKSNPNAMVLATSHKSCAEEVWIKAVIAAKAAVERRFKKQERPWFAQINRQGEITVCETIKSQTTRRKRPKEK